MPMRDTGGHTGREGVRGGGPCQRGGASSVTVSRAKGLCRRRRHRAGEGRPPVEVGADRAKMEPMDPARREVHARATQLAARLRCDVAAPRLPCDVNK
jgi:hypothetical protein